MVLHQTINQTMNQTMNRTIILEPWAKPWTINRGLTLSTDRSSWNSVIVFLKIFLTVDDANRMKKMFVSPYWWGFYLFTVILIICSWQVKTGYWENLLTILIKPTRTESKCLESQVREAVLSSTRSNPGNRTTSQV